MDFKKLLIALLIFGAAPAFAQTASEQYGTNDEHNEQVKMIANELDLEIPEVYQISQIMEKKKIMKESTLENIEKLKNDLRSFEASAAKQIEKVLTEEQYEKYLKDIKPELEKLSEERLEKVKIETDKE